MSAAPALELADIQGGILRGFGFPRATYVLVRTTGGETARGWLDQVLRWVPSAERWETKPRVAVNIALTASGLEALGVDTAGFPPEFRAGMASRAERLGDTGPNAPATWQEGLRGVGEGHVLVWVQGEDRESIDEVVRMGRNALASRSAGEVVWQEDAAVLPSAREHFGFADGFAQPTAAGSGQPNRPGEGVPTHFGRWRMLKAGELVLGYEDEDDLLPPAPPAPLDRNATFMVLRKLRQHVDVWRRWVREAADRHAGGDRDWIAAKVVGRWPDGTPVAIAPGSPQARTIGDLRYLNDFRYGDDPLGLRCPVGAHIRRVNPREALAGGSARTRRHRMVRRGMPYGPPLDGEQDDGVDRGLLFACFNASIARQFEIVQRWQVDGNVFGLGPACRDFFTGCGDGTDGFKIPGAPPVMVDGPGQPFVSVRGGEYLFVPSLSGLRAIADGTAAAAARRPADAVPA